MFEKPTDEQSLAWLKAIRTIEALQKFAGKEGIKEGTKEKIIQTKDIEKSIGKRRKIDLGECCIVFYRPQIKEMYNWIH